jgi:hypothetical protein
MVNNLRKSLPPLPERMQDLPISASGYPIPYFVKWFDGVPDFRILDPEKIIDCVENRKCWCCGKDMDTIAFVAGPGMVINFSSAEPPSHPECAEFAVKACPFMRYPKAQRRETDMPEASTDYAPGALLVDNPGVSVVFHTTGYQIIQADESGFALQAFPPSKVDWYSEGKLMTREEARKALHKRVRDMKEALSPLSKGENHTIDLMALRGLRYLPQE